jgi:hypothetical protein
VGVISQYFIPTIQGKERRTPVLIVSPANFDLHMKSTKKEREQREENGDNY